MNLVWIANATFYWNRIQDELFAKEWSFIKWVLRGEPTKKLALEEDF